MKLGTMFRDVSVSLFRRPVTEKYPFERREAPRRLRGLLKWNPEKCTGCTLCAQDCPSGALEVAVLDRQAKRFVVTYHVDRCTFCAQCVQGCRQGCLYMAHDEWELAALNKEPFSIYFGDPADVEKVLAGNTSGSTEACEEV